MVFDAKRIAFINEIKARPCIWNTNICDYNDRVKDRILKTKAWQEIAAVMYQDWLTLEEKFKRKRIQHLQKKWKSLRDYYVREQRKGHNNPNGVSGRNRKALQLLSFLSANESNETFTNDAKDHESSSTSESEEVRKRPALKRSQKLQEAQTDADMNFLLSLLPYMKSMTPQQNFEFRFEIMQLIKNIKYSDSSFSASPSFMQVPVMYENPLGDENPEYVETKVEII